MTTEQIDRINAVAQRVQELASTYAPLVQHAEDSEAVEAAVQNIEAAAAALEAIGQNQ